MVEHVRGAFHVSIRRACRALPAPRSTYHYRSRRPEQAVLRKRIREIAEARPSFGYMRIHVLLRREGWPVNPKRVHRLYRLEGLQMRHKRARRRVMVARRDERTAADGPNGIWAMDWMHDELFDGRRLWVLTVVDTWSRFCPVLRVCRQAKALDVVEALKGAVTRYGGPSVIRVDQGCQFTSREVDLWAHGAGVRLDFSRRGKPSGQCPCRSLQRSGACGMPPAELVPEPGGRAGEVGSLAGRLQ
jgi:putative transposase